MTARRTSLALAGFCLALLALVLVACGGGSGSVAAITTPTQPETVAASAATVPPAPTPETGAAPWPAPTDVLEAVAAAGLEPLRQEFLQYHVHTHLDVYVNGEAVLVPAGIGINIDDPGLRRGEACEQPCISPLHTHDNTGLIHTESADSTVHTLGQFFAEWGVRLDDSCVGGYCRPEAAISVFLDGQPYEGDPAAIALEDLVEVAIAIGTPPPEIPSTYEEFEPVA